MLPAEIETAAIDQIRGLDTPALRGELARALTITAQGLTYLAAVWAELERRGEDLSDLRSGMAAYLPQIASGRLAAEAVVQFAGQRSILKRIVSLPVEEQLRIAHGEPLPVVIDEDGSLVERHLPARALTARQVSQVFDDFGRIRTPIEQRQLTPARVTRHTRPSRPELDAAIAMLTDDDLQRLAESRGLTLAKRCTKDACKRPAMSKGLCDTHYAKSRREP